MQYILYNGLSNNGTGEVFADECIASISGETEKISVVGLNMNDFISKLTAEDIVYLVGGDGTINHFANDVYGKNIPCEIMIYSGGTGNDFLRDLKENYGVQTTVALKKYIEKLPTVKVKDIECHYINGIGFGIDGMVCEEADKMKANGAKKINYTTLAIKLLLFKFKCPKATVTVDGNVYEYKKVWFASAMNGRYYGGGMKVAPDQDRCGDNLTCVIMHDKGKIPTLIAFPGIFEGKHVNNKKLTDVYVGKKINVKFDLPTALQIDGETVVGVTEYTAWK